MADETDIGPAGTPDSGRYPQGGGGVSSPFTDLASAKVRPAVVLSSLREQFGLHPETEVTFEAARNGVLVRPAASAKRRRLQAWLRRARGSSTTRRTTAEIIELTRGEN